MADEAAVGFLLDNLKQLLLYNVHLILDVKNDVESLHEDMKLLKAFLKDMSQRTNNQEVLNQLVRQIRDLVYDAEDSVDLYVSQAAMQQARGPMKKVLHIFDHGTKLRNMAVDIKKVKEKVSEIYQNKKFGFEAALQAAVPTPKKRKAPKYEDNVVGFKDEAETITNLLTGEAEELQVISIVGMAGLGKTTLARMIYCDPNTEYEFCNRAWVYLSQTYNRKEVLQDILRQFTKSSKADMDEVDLENELTSLLVKVKYLIVIDDVWSAEAWEDLKNVFPDNGKKSRILLTTRIKTVAIKANPHVQPHQLRFLTTEESKTLLRRKALGSEECPDELSDYELLIVDKCKGLPLALVVIGGILLGKGRDGNSWEKVSGSVPEFLNMDEGKNINDVIELSFSNLPYQLKPCFLYLGTFPEDFQIPVWKLLQLWIAEGFIQKSLEGKMSLEDIAEEYLEDFISRNLVMVGDRRSNGKAKTCQVHDMLHIFCKKQAADEGYFFEITQHNPSKPAKEKQRRLCIHSKISNYISSKPSGPRVRSFLCFARDEIILEKENCSSIPKAFKLLRVLDAKPIRLTRFPVELTLLIHLRYLVLSCEFKILPEALSSLWNLQSLVVETTSRTLDIKADVWKMIQFKHLKTNASTTVKGPPSNSRRNKDESSLNLRTLSTISPKCCTEDVFAAAPNLSKLGIRGKLAKLLDVKGNGSSLFDSLGRLEFLENLKLWNDVHPLPPSDGKIHALPPNYKFPSNLTKLTIVETQLEWEHMSILGMLEKLKILKLKDNAFQGRQWKTKEGGFGSLLVLHIGKTDLVFWEASATHFPRLRCLYLNHCNKLDAVPFDLAKIPSLEILDLNCTTPSAARSAKKIKEHKNQTGGNGFKLFIYPPDQVN